MTGLEQNYMQSVIGLSSALRKAASAPKEIDWEQCRYEIAKAYVAASYSTDGHRGDADIAHDAATAVRVADALIAELRKTA